MNSGGTSGHGAWLRWARRGAVSVVALFIIMLTPLAAFAGSGPDWTTYQNEIGRSGDNSAETVISPSSAPHLKLHWTHTAGGSIFTQPAVANSLVYWGSWDGYEHATDFNNNRVWSYSTGKTVDNNCDPTVAGVSSSSTIATVTINGTPTSVDFFGGGTAVMNALNAVTGKLIWSTTLGSSPDHFIWSSSAVYNGNVYIGVASFGDCPLVQGQEVELNAATGKIESTFNAVPNGCTGAGIWGTAAIDPSAGTLYIDTGNSGTCGSSEPYGFAVVELSLSNLSNPIGFWQIPANARPGDSDFGATPTLFSANGNNYVGAVNKNGIFYAFKRGGLGSGPVWTQRVGNGGDCPQCGTGNISPAAWDGSTLYLAGGTTTINGASCKGSVNAVNPANGSYIWRHCLNSGPVLGAVTTANGVVVVSQGTDMNIIQASNGNSLFHFSDKNSGSLFYGPASISHGIIYIGNMDGRLYAIGT